MAETRKLERDMLVISNYWHNPKIRAVIMLNKDAPKGAIRLELEIDDFVSAIIAELSHPVRRLTLKTRDADVRSAVKAVLEKTKMASTDAVSTL
jgi:hypothetical protein